MQKTMLQLWFLVFVFVMLKNALTTPIPPSPQSTDAYVGCYRERLLRDMKEIKFVSNTTVNVSYCQEQCMGYSFTGIHNGTECACSNRVGAYGAYNNGCNKKCLDSSLCGGNWAISVYSTANNGNLGCYENPGRSNRQVLASTLHNMTVSKCREFCKSYSHLALEETNCWCLSSLEGYHVSTDSNKCNYKCNDSSICGGKSVLSIYNSIGQATISKNVFTRIYKGCYQNTMTSPYLGEFKSYSLHMTVDYCLTLCKDYRYFGVEEALRCWCGNTLDPDEPLPDLQCTKKCYNGMACGDTWKFSAYSVESLSSVGCYEDKHAVTNFQKFQMNPANISIVECLIKCENSPILAVNANGDCRCGKSFPPSLVKVDKCQQICPDDGYFCGGANSVSVYKLETKKNRKEKYRKQKPKDEESAYYLVPISNDNIGKAGLIDMADGNEYIVLAPSESNNYGEHQDDLSPVGSVESIKNMDADELAKREAIDNSGLANRI